MIFKVIFIFIISLITHTLAFCSDLINESDLLKTLPDLKAGKQYTVSTQTGSKYEMQVNRITFEGDRNEKKYSNDLQYLTLRSWEREGVFVEFFKTGKLLNQQGTFTSTIKSTIKATSKKEDVLIFDIPFEKSKEIFWSLKYLFQKIR